MQCTIGEDKMEEHNDSANKQVEPKTQLDKKILGRGNYGSSGSEDDRDPSLGQDPLQTESSVTFEILATERDFDSFFHAVFGEDSSGTFKANRVKDMRDEWYNFLCQFTSLQDPNMPTDLKKQLKEVLEKAFDEIVLEPETDCESIASTVQLNDDNATGNIDHGITNHVAKSAAKHFLKSIKETYESAEIYKFYLDSIRSTDHWVSLEEVPILASLANIEIKVYYGRHNQHLTFKPNKEKLLEVHERNRSLWGDQMEVIVYYKCFNFSRAIDKSTLEALQSKGLAYPTGISADACSLAIGNANSELIMYDGTGNFYNGECTANQEILGFGRLLSQDGKEFVAGEWQGNEWTDVLQCKLVKPSFKSPFIYTKINDENGLLTSVDKEFIARVQVIGVERLHLTRSYPEIRNNIFQKLKIVEIIENRNMDEYNEACDRFIDLLRERSERTADCYQYAEDLLQFSKALDNFKWNLNGVNCRDTNSRLLNYIINTEQVSQKVKDKIKKLQRSMKTLLEWDSKFPEVQETKTRDLLALLSEVFMEGVRCHKNSLLSKCPSSNTLWMECINSLSEKSMLYMSSRDLKLFQDLEAVVDQQKYPTLEVKLSYQRLFKEFFGELRRSFFKSANQMKKHVSLKDHAPLTNPVYLYLYKSFQEFLIDLCSSADIRPESFFTTRGGTWIMKSKVLTSFDDSHRNRVLEQLCRFIFESMEFFQPGSSPPKGKRSIFRKCYDLVTSSKPENIDVPQDHLIWFNIVNNAMISIEKALPSGLKERFKKMSSPLKSGYKSSVQQECGNFGMLQNIAREIVQESLMMAENLEIEGRSVSADRETIVTLLSYIGENEKCLHFGISASPPIMTMDTKCDADSFFHAVFGEDHSGTFLKERSKDMRAEWHKFLDQFTSLQDPDMPPALKKQLKDVVKRAVNDIVTGSISRGSTTSNDTLQLYTPKKRLGNEETIYLSQSLSKYHHKINRETYDRNDLEDFTEFLYGDERFYNIYLGSIKNSSHWVSLEDIPILASMANIEIEVRCVEINQHLTFKPIGKDLLGSYRNNSLLWSSKEKAIVFHKNCYFYPAQVQSTPEPTQSDESEKETTNISSARMDHSASKNIQYDGLGNFFAEGLDGDAEILGFGRSLSEDGEQYIAGEWKDNEWTHVLLCKVKGEGMTSPLIYTRVDGEDGLLTSADNNFLAKVRIDDLRGICMTWSFPATKEYFIRRLKLVKVIKDQIMDEYNKTVDGFEDFIKTRSHDTVNCFECAEDFLQIFKILEKSRLSLNSSGSPGLDLRFLNDIVRNEHVSEKLIDMTSTILIAKRSLDARNSAFPGIQIASTRDVSGELLDIYAKGVECHKKNLLDKCPTSTTDSSWALSFDSLSNEQALLINSRDLQLLLDLETAATQQLYSMEDMKSTYTCLFQQFVGDLRQDFFKKVNGMKEHNSLQDHAPLTNPVYLNLYRGFQELLIQVCTNASISPQSFLTKSDGKWMLDSGAVPWPVVSPANQVLEQQCRYIFKWMEHFQPGNYFQRDSKTRLQGAIDGTRSMWTTSLQPENIDLPDDRLIWLMIVDDAIASIVKRLSTSSKETFRRLYDHLMIGYKDFVQQESDNFESFRTTAHCIIKLAAHMSSRVSVMRLSSEIDGSLLEKQVSFISNTISAEGNERLGDYFAILINVLNDYWELNESFVPEVRKRFFDTTFHLNMQSIKEEWSRIMNTVFNIGGGNLNEIINFMRAFAEFVDELKYLKFAWFVKKCSTSTELLSAEILEAVDNKLSNEPEASYLVKEPETFVRVLGEEKRSIPPHYVIRIVQKMLATVNTALQRRTLGDSASPDNSKRSNMVPALLSAMRSSFLYLKEQPDYRDFELFFRESTEPFVNVLNEAQEDITERIARIKESFWYIRKQDEIGIKKALDLFESMNNGSYSRDTLKSCYDNYLNQFNSFLDIYSKEKSTEVIIASVRELAQKAKDFGIEEWTPEFKKNTIPAMLAGLAAIWCIRESKDIASTGKSLKPHCVQILCIIRLLSVDMSLKGVQKHLAQVSTGQGKSLVLGLLSSLLALVGYNVRVVCYSRYLSSRDKEDFKGFFEEFKIKDEITYGTFEDMAFDCVLVAVDGEKQWITQLVDNRIRGTERIKRCCRIKDTNVKNTILLIDEVDVFFSDEFYGNSLGLGSIVGMPMFAEVQTEVWKTIEAGCHDQQAIVEKMQTYVSGLNEESRNFLSNPRTYDILRQEQNKRHMIVKYSNRSLFDEQLKVMIEHALSVHSGRGQNNKFIINEEGIVAFRSNDGLYRTRRYAGYKNTFNYFRLKGSDYDHKNYQNYGYLVLDCGAIAYAKLPEEYPLILGVSGTLKGLNEHERATISDIYKINRESIMPSYFGNTNLKFDEKLNLMILETEEAWLDMIFSHADSQIRSERSVLIFFETEEEIDKFEKTYHSKIARLYVLTVNTEPLERERYVTEAGVAKTVTLATRTMGRGVDFKSSLAVERNDGIHVIQTFFSLDNKEETQIKGRTARKDNQGSYELILCQEQLRKEGYLEMSDVSVNYAYLSGRRKELVDVKGADAADEIKASEKKHSDTMKFLKTFCY